MTATNELNGGQRRTALAVLNRSVVTLTAAVNRLLRLPRVHRVTLPLAPARLTAFAAGGAVAVAAILFCMMYVDAPAATAALRLPHQVRWFFDQITDLGKSGWFLWPLGLLFLALTFLPRERLTPFSQRVLAAAMVRVGFLFLAIGVPGLFVSIIKRFVGRARPMVTGTIDPLVFDPTNWSAAYASLPSGHGTTAFSVLVAFGALWPRARAALWIYALVILVSRVVVSAHYPSDVLAGAVVGTVGTLMVRRYFALRNLGFSIGPDGAPCRYPGPSWRRIKAVARTLLSP